MESNALWRRIIEAKYGCMLWGGGGLVLYGPYGVGLWKYIRKGWEEFYSFIIFKVGDGSCIKFWHDPWCEEFPLESGFL